MTKLASVDMEPGVFVENAEEVEGGISEEVLDRLRDALVEETGAVFNGDGSITYERSEDMDPPSPGDPASSGEMVVSGDCPASSLSILATAGIRVDPPTISK